VEGIERHEMREKSMENTARSMSHASLVKVRRYGEGYSYGDSVWNYAAGTHVESTSQIGLFKIVSEAPLPPAFVVSRQLPVKKRKHGYRNLEKNLRMVEQLLNNPQDVEKLLMSCSMKDPPCRSSSKNIPGSLHEFLKKA